MDTADRYKKALRDEMNNLADHLAGGGAQSMEDYRYVCGVIRGLAVAERHLIDLLDQAEKEE